MPEIRIDRDSSGRRLLITLSEEREIDNAGIILLKKVAINTAITCSMEAVPNPFCG